MFSSFVHLKEHNILLISPKKECAFPNNQTASKEILELIDENMIFKLILDYRDPDFTLTEKDIVAFSKYFQQSGDAYFAIIVDDIKDNCISDPDSEMLLRNFQLKFRLFDEMSYALDWLKSI
jgi:hypothetical protein